MAGYRLGLDLGPTSIGWALIGYENYIENRLIDVGVRVFPEGVDRDTRGLEKSKNEGRRIARGTRRQKERRRRRKLRLVRLLKEVNLWPAEPEEVKKLFQTDPYTLRVRGLDEKLELFELGRVLYHLNQRRGFKSNRKSGKSKDDGKVMQGITELERKMNEVQARTLGEFLFKIKACERIRNHYTRRDMYQTEFEKIWDKQKEYYPNILTDQFKRQLADEVIFFQRPLKPQDDLIGKCELEPDQPRCPKADWYAQRFRIVQDVNNLQIIGPRGEKEPLSAEQRQKLIGLLSQEKEMDFDKIRKKLGLIETQKFNLEEGGRKKLLGNSIEYGLRKTFGRDWPKVQGQLDRFNDVLLNVEDTDEFERICREEWNLSDKQIQEMHKISLPQKYLHLSKAAIKKLLPFMETGCLYTEAMEQAHYLRNDQKPVIFRDKLKMPPDLRNPIVQRALFEVRKVVNAIIREYGKPGEIVIELAREVKGSADQRNELLFEMRQREREREEVKELLIKEFNFSNPPSRSDIDRYRLWQDQGTVCPYSGQIIARNQLFTSDVQVDHILPYSRSLDDSYANKVVCLTNANREKNNRTPFEWLSGDPDRYEAMLLRVSKFTGKGAAGKKRKFFQKEVEVNECIKRQLNDTRYICREVTKYLRMLGVNVTCTKGQMTAELRHQWGLNQILDHKTGFTKNRDDHRHHAVDAIVIALTTPRHLQLLSRTKGILPEPLPMPWNGFRDEVANRINTINVSHRVTRKVCGALHEETAYGPTRDENVFVCRKELSALKGPMIERIRDKTIQAIVKQRLAEHGLDPENPPSDLPRDVFVKPLLMPSGVPIKRVRIRNTFTNLLPVESQKTRYGKPYRYVSPGSNHHIEIYEDSAIGKREGVVVSMFEAAQRVRQGKPVIQRRHKDGKRFVMSLSQNEMFLLKINELYVLHRIQKFDVNGGII
ncbi:MAG: type II CRISPR RNA-guided endonuclease Cas9, partial [Phycisphaerae bacterium]|nr:type II CRISPR RNA-guided endonuclease Cas9 [Phycisphaerae bacterium]